jgi:hypothetical protein
MTIKHLGGIFGRNPTFNDVTIDGPLSANDNIVMASGKGIDFSATSGTGTSELFDDYEEGTWTPAYSTVGGGHSQTYSIQAGTYTKVGNLVTCHFRISISASSNIGSGNVRITGLPFAANGSNNLRAPFSTFNVDYEGAAGTKMHFYTTGAGVSFLQIIYTRDNTSWIIGNTTNFDIGTGQSDIVCSAFSYYTDS